MISKTFQASIAVGLMVLIATPLVSFAQRDMAATRAEAVAKGTEKFCDNLENRRENFIEKRNQYGTDFENRRRNQLNTIRDKQTKRHEADSDKREAADTKREEHYEKLRERAETDEQMTAVENFITTVEDLIETRRNDIDAVYAQLAAEAEALYTERDAALHEIIAQNKEIVHAAFDSAADACRNGIDNQTIIGDLRTALDAARIAFTDARANAGVMNEYQSTRNEAKTMIEAARTAFKEGLEEARAELKAAFEANAESEDSE